MRYADPFLLDLDLTPADVAATLPREPRWGAVRDALDQLAVGLGPRPARDDLTRRSPCAEYRRATGGRCPGAAVCPAARAMGLPAAPLAPLLSGTVDCADQCPSVLTPVLLALDATAPAPGEPLRLPQWAPAGAGAAVVLADPDRPGPAITVAVQIALDGNLVERFRLAIGGLATRPLLAESAAPVQLVKKLHPDLDALIAEYALAGGQWDGPVAHRRETAEIAIRRAMERLRTAVEDLSTV
ncbi:MAG TPA: hypothetical protein VHL09_04340 [Dehalococcoidia bacterium]|nr:hypothetical protein [Dehalococcoidia bacterium]